MCCAVRTATKSATFYRNDSLELFLSLEFLLKLKKTPGGNTEARKRIRGIKLTVLVLVALTKRNSICNFCFALLDLENENEHWYVRKTELD